MGNEPSCYFLPLVSKVLAFGLQLLFPAGHESSTFPLWSTESALSRLFRKPRGLISERQNLEF